MNSTHDKSGNGLTCFLLGAAIGAVAVALTTPCSGSLLRSDLKAMGERLKVKAKRMGDEVKAAAEEA